MQVSTTSRPTAATEARARRIAALPAFRFVPYADRDREVPVLLVSRTGLVLACGDARYRWHAGLLHTRLEAGFSHPLVRAIDLRRGDRVVDCSLEKSTGEVALWSPTGRVPPPRADNPYLDDSAGLSCRIRGCAIDERTELTPATAGAIRSLTEAWEDPELRASGAGAVLTILSHNAGYLDRRFGVERASNVRPAYMAWRRGVDQAEWHTFYGKNLTCRGGHAELSDTCDSHLAAQTQHYGYTVLAQHLVAMCFLGRHYGDQDAFVHWADRAIDDEGVCSRFVVPAP